MAILNASNNTTDSIIPMDEDQGDQIRVSLVLVPGVNDPSLEVPSNPIAVPPNLRRRGLSAVVNHLLGRKVDSDESGSNEDESDDDDSDDEDKPPSIAFDFLVNNKLLRMGIESAARSYGLSMEEAIKIKYFPAASAPEGSGTSEDLPDWVSAMSYSSAFGSGAIITGGYDGVLRVFSSDGCEEMASMSAHAGPVKCLSSLTRNDAARDVIVATGSIDQTLVTHTLSSSGDDNAAFALHGVYSGGHLNSIESVALLRSSAGGALMASGDWDGGMCLWNVANNNNNNNNNNNDDEAQLDKKKKKRRTDSPSVVESSESIVQEVQPTSSWKAHASNISGICWGEHGDGKNIITSSWDHSLKVWDTERLDCILALNGSRVVSALGRCSNSDIVATGHPDCTLRLWDMRTGKGTDTSNKVSESTLKPSHKAWVSALEWSPTEPHVLATNSHDGTIKMWDIRSSLPLHTIRAHEKGQKGFCLSFGNKSLFTGGSDCVVKKFSCS